jgi:hypothetical protein
VGLSRLPASDADDAGATDFVETVDVGTDAEELVVVVPHRGQRRGWRDRRR